MNKIFVLIIMTLSAIIGSIIMSILKLQKYMRNREKEGKSWIDPAEPEEESGGVGE